MKIGGLFAKSNSCTCEKYTALELNRVQISKRIKDSKKIINHLEKKGESPEGHHLYQCKFCVQFWQLSGAWNWGGKDYLFKIPDTKISEWIYNPYMSPAEMIIYSASLKTYFDSNTLEESAKNCRREACSEKALVNDVLCKTHFIESLQQFGQLPKFPSGKLFEPYNFEN